MGIQGDKQQEIFYKIRNAYILIYERAPYSMKQVRTVIDGLRLSQNKEEIAQVFQKASAGKAIFEEAKAGKVSQTILNSISDDFAKYQLAKAVLNMDFVEFIIDILTAVDTTPIINFPYKKWKTVDLEFPTLPQIQSLVEAPLAANLLQSMECWKFLLKFVFTVVIRVNRYSKDKLYNTLRAIKQLLKTNLQFCIWFVET